MTEPFNRARPPKYAERKASVRSFGGQSDYFLRSLTGTGAQCTVWDPAKPDNKHKGVIFRDRHRGLLVDVQSSWIPDQRIAPNYDEKPAVLHGASGELGRFSLHDCQVVSGLSESEVRAAVGFFGHIDKEDEPEFDNFTLFFDGLSLMFGDRSFQPNGELFDLPEEVVDGQVTVTPKRSVANDDHDIRVLGYSLELRSVTKHDLQWWIDEWVNPLQQLFSICLGYPITLTFMTSRVEWDHERSPMDETERCTHTSDVWVASSKWPTLDMDANQPTVRNSGPKPLLRWRDECFDLPTLRAGMKRVSDEHDLPLNNYLETIYSMMSPATKFLNLVQAVESLHSRDHGEFREGESEVPESQRILASQVSSTHQDICYF